MDNGEGYRWHRSEKAQTDICINLPQGNVCMHSSILTLFDIGVSYVEEKLQNIKQGLILEV